ncbi:hypothetical protein ABPG75_008263 [Micractinium tetrahymenae]
MPAAYSDWTAASIPNPFFAAASFSRPVIQDSHGRTPSAAAAAAGTLRRACRAACCAALFGRVNGTQQRVRRAGFVLSVPQGLLPCRTQAAQARPIDGCFYAALRVVAHASVRAQLHRRGCLLPAAAGAVPMGKASVSAQLHCATAGIRSMPCSTADRF